MSTPPYQQPYQQPYQPPFQPQYQAAPPYGRPRPLPTHTGKLVGAIILFLIGPFLGFLITGIGFVILAANIATSGDVISNGQQITLSSGEERTVYVPEDYSVDACSVTASDGKEVSTSRSTGSHITNNDGRFDSVLTFRATQSGEYRISCDGLSDSDSVLVGPGINVGQFTWPIIAGIGAGAACWIIAIILFVRRQQALNAQSQMG